MRAREEHGARAWEGGVPPLLLVVVRRRREEGRCGGGDIADAEAIDCRGGGRQDAAPFRVGGLWAWVAEGGAFAAGAGEQGGGGLEAGGWRRGEARRGRGVGR